MNSDDTVSISLPKELVEEWKFLVQKRQEAEGRSVDPVEALRQAIANETYIWQKVSGKSRSRQQTIRFGILGS
jgi:metal-responsive CopG/Arc/MetJ family transcriptional regulator